MQKKVAGTQESKRQQRQQPGSLNSGQYLKNNHSLHQLIEINTPLSPLLYITR